MTFVSETPFYLMRERGMTHDQIWREQQTLLRSGRSLWDWPTYICLYWDRHRGKALIDGGTPWKREEALKAHAPKLNMPTDMSAYYNPRVLSRRVTGSYDNVDIIIKFAERLHGLYRDVICLLYKDQLSIPEVMEDTGLSEDMVYWYISRALRSLRGTWKKCVHESGGENK